MSYPRWCQLDVERSCRQREGVKKRRGGDAFRRSPKKRSSDIDPDRVPPRKDCCPSFKAYLLAMHSQRSSSLVLLTSSTTATNGFSWFVSLEFFLPWPWSSTELVWWQVEVNLKVELDGFSYDVDYDDTVCDAYINELSKLARIARDICM